MTFCFEVRSVLTLFWRAGSVLILRFLGGAPALLGIDPNNNILNFAGILVDNPRRAWASSAPRRAPGVQAAPRFSCLRAQFDHSFRYVSRGSRCTSDWVWSLAFSWLVAREHASQTPGSRQRTLFRTRVVIACMFRSASSECARTAPTSGGACRSGR